MSGLERGDEGRHSYKVQDYEGTVKRRRYTPHKLLAITNLASTISKDRMKSDEKGTNK